MKLVIALIRPERLDDVKRELESIGIRSATIVDVRAWGVAGGAELLYRGHPVEADLAPRLQLEIVVDDKLVDAVIEAIVRGAYTGRPGDGEIIVVPVERSVDVREYYERLSGRAEAGGGQEASSDTR